MLGEAEVSRRVGALADEIQDSVAEALELLALLGEQEGDDLAPEVRARACEHRHRLRRLELMLTELDAGR